MKLISSLLFSFILVACHLTSLKAQEQNKTLVGTLVNDRAILNVDKLRMLSIYNDKLFKLSGIDAKFIDIIIKTTSDKHYFLVFKGTTYVSSFIVTPEGPNLFVNPSISCTTSDCSSEEFGCTPKPSGVSCYPCNNKGKCTKTVSSDSLIE